MTAGACSNAPAPEDFPREGWQISHKFRRCPYIGFILLEAIVGCTVPAHLERIAPLAIRSSRRNRQVCVADLRTVDIGSPTVDVRRIGEPLQNALIAGAMFVAEVNYCRRHVFVLHIAKGLVINFTDAVRRIV